MVIDARTLRQLRLPSRDYLISFKSEASKNQNLFLRLTKSWREATQYISSTTDMVMHPAYQRIIGMGPAALPLILRELAREPDHWFWALQAITGEDPVPPAARGNLSKMTDAWLRWASLRGINPAS
ncbi:MAG: hypothetical protein WAM82_09520 [Thermoanaerobaculia bacterium]